MLRIRMVGRLGKPVSEHALLTTNVTGDQEFCAESHCRGDCGYPGLFLRWYYNMEVGVEREDADASRAPSNQYGHYHDYKAHGSMVAAGSVWQRKTWEGERVYLPREYQTDTVFKMWWF